MTQLRRLVAILFVVALALTGPALAAAQTATATPGGQLDLAALTLTPGDLAQAGLSGFLHDGAFV
ncbi:MAG TPA: hypothetical protein VFA70_08580, partial [Dehalococcoidia bacterium]|nr:hypothetical protein [Dehalococcoidia bacterium]